MEKSLKFVGHVEFVLRDGTDTEVIRVRSLGPEYVPRARIRKASVPIFAIGNGQ